MGGGLSWILVLLVTSTKLFRRVFGHSYQETNSRKNVKVEFARTSKCRLHSVKNICQKNLFCNNLIANQLSVPYQFAAKRWDQHIQNSTLLIKAQRSKCQIDPGLWVFVAQTSWETVLIKTGYIFPMTSIQGPFQGRNILLVRSNFPEVRLNYLSGPTLEFITKVKFNLPLPVTKLKRKKKWQNGWCHSDCQAREPDAGKQTAYAGGDRSPCTWWQPPRQLQSSSIIICHAVTDPTRDIPAIMSERTQSLCGSCDLLTGSHLNGLTVRPVIETWT